MKKHYVYKVTNNLNGMIYVGVHSSDDIDSDDYMGSGIRIKRAIEHHGLSNFSRDILFEFDTSELAYKKEAEIVDESFVKRGDTYNLTIGGNGGWYHVDSTGDNNPMRKPDVVAKVKESCKLTRSSNPEKYNAISRSNFRIASDRKIGQKDSIDTIEKRRKSLLKYFETNDHASKGKTMSNWEIERLKSGWTDDVRKKHSERHKELCKTKDMEHYTAELNDPKNLRNNVLLR